MKISPKDSLSKIIEQLWGTLRRATADNRHPFRNCYLATAGEGPIALRTVILRQVEDQQLWIYTDIRSGKVRHIKTHPESALLFYDTRKRFQVQALARGAIHHQNQIAREHFEALSSQNLKDYQGVVAPGKALEAPQEQTFDPEFSGKYFAAISFDVMRFDLLQLHKDGHLRCGFKRTGNTWKGQWLAP